jgi:threonine synthase
MFNHHTFRDRVRLSGVNSINWARIVAQAVYYFTAAVALGAPERKVAFTVPTGNFGDVFAGYVAAQMGLPVERLVVASNVNDILPRTFATGTYEVRGVTATSSPSMDIQVSSNFERLLFEAYDRDPAAIRALMGSLTQSGRFSVSSPALKKMRDLFSAGRADEDETAATTRAWMREASYCADPHTAVALAVAEKEPRDPHVPMVVLSTAHPAKFPDAVKAACGRTPALPEWVGDLNARPETMQILPSDQVVVEKFVASASRAAQEGAKV